MRVAFTLKENNWKGTVDLMVGPFHKKYDKKCQRQYQTWKKPEYTTTL